MGGQSCMVTYCKNNSKTSGVSLFKLPNDLHLRTKWLNALLIKGHVTKNAVLCSDHFNPADVNTCNAERKKLRTGAIPISLNATHVVELPVNVNEDQTFTILIENSKLVLQLRLKSTGNCYGSTIMKATRIVPFSTETNSCKLEKNSKRTSMKNLRQMLIKSRQLKKKTDQKLKLWIKRYQGLLAFCKKNKIAGKSINKQVALAKSKVHELYTQKLRPMFSENQIRKILSGKRINWTTEDISKAVSLCYGSNPYEQLLQMKHPLPCPSTLRTWCLKIDFRPGIDGAASVLNLLASRFQNSSDIDRQCVVSFDEMSINPKYEYDSKTDTVFGGKKNVTAYIVRGLFSNWKQIFCYDFDDKLRKEEFFHMIGCLEKTGLVVRAVVTDLGPNNRRLWKQVGVTLNCKNDEDRINYVRAPINNNKIYFFADAPHLIKLLRNHMLGEEKGLVLKGGQIVVKVDFKKLLMADKGEFQAAWKVTESHLEFQENRDKMRVYLAVQVLSSTVAQVWKKVFPNRIVEAEFIETVNNAFDVFNSRHLNYNEPMKMPYGLHIEVQQNSLEKMKAEILGLKVIGSASFLPFQYGYLMSIQSLQDLYSDMKCSPLKIQYIQTRCVNQDVTENCFSRVRDIGGTNNPSALETTRRFKRVMLSSSKTISLSANVVQEDKTPYLSESLLRRLINNTPYQEEVTSVENSMITDEEQEFECVGDEFPTESDDFEVELENQEEFELSILQKECQQSGMEFVAGYVASKLQDSFPYLAASEEEKEMSKNSSWVQQLNKKNLTIPSTKWLSQANNLNKEFLCFHANPLRIFQKGILKGFVKGVCLKYQYINGTIVSLYQTTRLHIRIRFLNTSMRDAMIMRNRGKEVRHAALIESVNRSVDQRRSSNGRKYSTGTSNTVVVDYLSVFNCDEFEWTGRLKALVQRFIGTNSLSPYQNAAINATLGGLDVIAVLPTGSGKSLIYQATALMSDGMTVVVSPLTSLIEDQVTYLKQIDIPVFSFSSQENQSHDSEQLQSFICNPDTMPNIMYITPEKLANSHVLKEFLETLHSEKRLDRFVIDEMHCIQDWGLTFRTAYDYVGRLKEVYKGVQILGLTATATPDLVEETKGLLHMESPAVFRQPLYQKNLKYEIRFTSVGRKNEDVIQTVRDFQGLSGIIYCLTVQDCTAIHQVLRSAKVCAATYHAKLDVSQRKAILAAWMDNKVQVMVATVAFGMGINKNNCRYIIHHSIPKSITEYVQETGRAGRDGLTASCVLFITMADVFRVLGMTCLERCMDVLDVLKYAFSTSCRKIDLAKYFGDTLELSLNEFCECDNCSPPIPSRTFEASVFVKDILKILDRAFTVGKDEEKRMTGSKILDILYRKNRDKQYQDIVSVPAFERASGEKVLISCILDEYLMIKYKYGEGKTYCYLVRGPKAMFLSDDLTYVISI